MSTRGSNVVLLAALASSLFGQTPAYRPHVLGLAHVRSESRTWAKQMLSTWFHPLQAPTGCRTAMLRRFQTLMLAMARIKDARAFSS